MYGCHSQTVDEDNVSASATSGHIAYGDMDDIPNPYSIYGVASDLIPDGSQSVAQRSEFVGGSNKLTISLRGQVYVFDVVGPDKVNVVLSLLGGSSSSSTELSSGEQVMELAQHNHMNTRIVVAFRIGHNPWTGFGRRGMLDVSRRKSDMRFSKK